MTHQPKTLALLISLIGMGVAPSVQARTDLRVVRLAQPELSSECQAPDVTALDLTRWSRGLVWRAEECAPEFNQVLQVAPELVRAYVEWAPGEAPEGLLESPAQPEPSGNETIDAIAAEIEPRLADIPLVREAQVQEGTGTALVHPGSVEQEQWRAELAQARERQQVNAAGQSVTSDSKPRLRDRLNRIRALIQTLGPQPKAASPVSATATVRFAGSAASSLDDEVASAHTDRLMQSLAAILRDDMTSLSRDRLLSTVAARFPAAFDAPPPYAPPAARGWVLRRVAAQPIERREIVVASQSDRVLRNLEAIVASGHREPGALVAEPSEMIVTTQAEKVLATLLELSTTRNARDKRDARDQRKQRDKHERTVATLSGDAATLPSAPALLPIAVAAHQPIDVDIDHAVARVAEPAAPLALLGAVAPTDLAHDAELGVAPSAAATAASTQRKPHPSPFGTRELAVSEASLDRVRGGFVTENLNISFGIERAVYVNGTLVTATSLNVSDLGRMTAGRGTAVFDSGTLALIQSGAGNMVSAGSLSPTSIGTVVQNTLDGQQIQNITVINATVNSLSLLRGLNLASSLRGAVIDSLRR